MTLGRTHWLQCCVLMNPRKLWEETHFLVGLNLKMNDFESSDYRLFLFNTSEPAVDLESRHLSCQVPKSAGTVFRLRYNIDPRSWVLY